MNNLRPKRQTYDVYIGNLPNNFNEKRLTQKFTAYGETLAVLFRPDKKKGKFAIFKYLCEPDAVRAVQECHNREWEGIYLTVRNDRRMQNPNARRDLPNIPMLPQEFHMRNFNPNYPMSDAGRNSYQNPFQAIPMNSGVNKFHQAHLPQNASAKDKNSSQLHLIEFNCTNVESPTIFYGHRYSQLEDVHNIQTNLQHECATIVERNTHPQCGEICAALFSEDRKWYRCIILKDDIPSKPGMCTIKYIDYGNIEDINCEYLVRLSKSMKTPPAFAIKCILQVEEITSLKEEAHKFLKDTLLGQKVCVWTNSPKETPVSVLRCVCNGYDVFGEFVKNGYIAPPKSVHAATANNNSNSQHPEAHIMPKQITSPLLPDPTPTVHEIYKTAPYGPQIPPSVSIYNQSNNQRPGPPDKYEQRPNTLPGTLPYNNKPGGGPNILDKLLGFNSSQQRVQKPPSSLSISQQTGKPNQRVVGADCKPGKIQILQRHVTEAPPSQDVMKLVSERDALKRELTEQYSHVKDLRSEIKHLQDELDKESMSRKIDSIISNLKLVNRLRDIVSSSTIRHFIDSTIKGLKSEQNHLHESKTRRQEVERISTLHSEALQQIKECKDKANLTELVAEKNKLTESLLAALKQYLEHFDLSLCNTKSFIETSIKELQSNENMFMDIALDKVPSSMDDLISSYQHVWESKQEGLHKIKESTNEKHKVSMGLFSELQKKFNLHNTANGGEIQEEEPGSFSSDLMASLSHLQDALSKEIAVYALNNDGKTETSIIRLLLTEMNAFEKEASDNFAFYETYSRLYKEYSLSSSSVNDTLSQLSSVKINMKSIKSKLRHKLADKKDLEENEDACSDAIMNLDFEIGSLQYQLHSLFQEEDSLKKELLYAYSSIYPEINIEHPELKLQYNHFVKQSWDPEHFTLKKLPNRLGVEYESKFMNKAVIIKEFVLENEDKINEFVTTVEKWDSVNSDFLINIRALFLKNERIMYTLIPQVSPSLVNFASSFTESKSRLILQQVLKGLNDLHSRGLMHGALNPHAVLCNDDNIMLDFFHKIKYKSGMSEFKSLSFQSQDVTQTQASDMYSFGCLILWVLFPNLPVSADFFNAPKALSFKSVLDQTLSEEEQQVVFTLLHDSPMCRPTAKELLDTNFLMNSTREPSTVVKDEREDLEIDSQEFDSRLPEPSTNDQIESETENKMEDNQDSTSQTSVDSSTMHVESESSQDLTSQGSVESSSAIESMSIQDLTSQISVELPPTSTKADEPDSPPEDCDSSTPESDLQFDILGSLNALRQPLAIPKPVTESNPISNEVIVDLINDAMSSAQDAMSDISIPTPPPQEDSDVDALATVNALRKSLDVLALNPSDSTEVQTVALLPDTTSGNCDSGQLGSPQEQLTEETESSTSQEYDMLCDSSTADAAESLHAISPSLDDDSDVTLITEDREVLVTEEECHMLDYVPNEET